MTFCAGLAVHEEFINAAVVNSKSKTDIMLTERREYCTLSVISGGKNKVRCLEVKI